MKAILGMMAIFTYVCHMIYAHLFSQNTYSVFLQDEITNQEQELMGEIDRSVLRSKGTTVRQCIENS